MDKCILKVINHYKNATHCDRCGCVLNGVKFMSIFTTECLCKSCKNDEKNQPGYQEACMAEQEATERGEWFFQGKQTGI